MATISITKAQMAAFTEAADERFVLDLADAIYDKYSVLLDGLARPGRERMVRAGISRAHAYGLTFETNLARFVSLMVNVAPDFDGQAAIHTQLTRNGDLSDNRFDSEIKIVPIPAWKDAVDNASGAGWFLPLPLPRTQRPQRIAAALPGAVADRRTMETAEAMTISYAAMQEAERRGLASEDAAWVVGIGIAVFGLAGTQAVLDQAGPGAAIAALRADLYQRAGVWTKRAW